LVAKGGDPRADRLRKKAEAEQARAEAALTLDTLITEWATIHLAQRRPRYAAEAQRAMRHALAPLLKRPAAHIARADAVNALDKLARAGKAAMAGRTLAYARACYRWAEKRGKVPTNPFQGLPISAGVADRERVLSDREVSEVWAASDKLGEPFGPFIKLLLLTLQRREEVAGMRWSELSADLTAWTIPGDRMKNGKAHVVHLAEGARTVLKGIERVEDRDLIFSTTGTTPVSGFSKAKALLDKKIVEARAEAAKKQDAEPEPLKPWWFHDFRRTGVSKLAEIGFDSIVVDKLLAHKPAKLQGVASVYQRFDFAPERARALDAWAAHVVASHTGNVVPMVRAAG
jgi:integrase